MKLYMGGDLPSLERSVITMGMFDGCHIGHRTVLTHAKAMAKRLQCPLLVWTYRNHPSALLRPQSAPGLLQDTSARAAMIARLGADLLIMNDFTQEIAQTPADAFLWHLCRRFGMRGIALGRSHTFGANRGGDVRLLMEAGRRTGFEVDVVNTTRIGGESVHSSAIRLALLEGRLAPASLMLGRLYSLGGLIEGGRKLGRKLGFPTINVRIPAGRLLPRFGVYAAYADLEGYAWPCVVNLGVKPTIGDGLITLEAYLLGFEGDIYDMRANIRFFEFLRPEQKFPSHQALSAQISRDVKRAREVLL